MEVTRVNIRSRAEKDSGICADCSVVLDDCLQINHIHIIKGAKGLFIAFPNTGDTKMFNNTKKFFDIVHPTNSQLRKAIEEKVLAEYNQA